MPSTYGRRSRPASGFARPAMVALAAVALTTASGCGSADAPPAGPSDAAASASPEPEPPPTSEAPHRLPAPGNPLGQAPIPAEAMAEDTSNPTRVIGDGTPASCTSEALVAAVAAGGVITFSCGPEPVTITMTATAKVRNANGPIVLDGGGVVTLSGGGETMEGGGGGAIFVRGGRFKVVNSRFVRNRCDGTGPDLGGAAIRVLSQHQGQPVYVVNSTFGGAPGEGGVCSNGGALSSIGVSWVVLNSVLSHNTAIGRGANPAKSGTPGGGSGGAIYLDGNRFTIRVAGSVIEHNHANEGGGAVFFVSNDRTGTMSIADSTLRDNPSDGFESRGLPGIFFLGASNPTITNSTLD